MTQIKSNGQAFNKARPSSHNSNARDVEDEHELKSSGRAAYYKARAREIDDRFDLESWLSEADGYDHEKLA